MEYERVQKDDTNRRRPDNHIYMGSGGYMSDNSVAYPTKESALDSAICAICGFDNEKRRDLRIKIHLEL